MEKPELQVRLADQADLLGIMWLIRQVVYDMNRNGMFHWNLYYPNENIIRDDISNDSLYLIKNKGICIGLIALNNQQVEEYDEINWSSQNDKSLIVHRLAVHPDHLNEGVRKTLLEFAEQTAKEKGYTHLRIDAFTGNTLALELYTEKGYVDQGDLLFKFQKIPYKCFEKEL